MRAIALCCALAACASFEPSAAPPERVAGCWINREVVATTMRWRRHPERSGVVTGAKLVYGAAGVRSSARYTLEPSETGWSLCELDTSGAASQCWDVAQGLGGSLEGGRAFIDANGDQLRISVLGDGPERIIFHGRRDGCD